MWNCCGASLHISLPSHRNQRKAAISTTTKEQIMGLTAIGSAIGAAGGIADQEAAGAAKEALNASAIKLKLEKAGQDNALSLI
jgi:hypothetical protein